MAHHRQMAHLVPKNLTDHPAAIARSGTEPGGKYLAVLAKPFIWLSNRVFEDYNAIVDAGCEAWKKLIAQPETIDINRNANNGPISVNVKCRWYYRQFSNKL